jgi:hypothetical protein
MTTSEKLLAKIEKFCGKVPPPLNNRPNDVWMPHFLMERQFRELFDNTHAWAAAIIFIAEWLKGERILKALAGPGFAHSNKMGVKTLSRSGVIIYDPIRDLAVIDEANLLALFDKLETTQL